MVDIGVLPGFMAVILLFLIPPGPDMAYMLAVGLQSGRRSALQAILGIGTGMSIYAAAVVIGVGKVVQDHPVLLDAVKVFGASYLLRLAYVTVRNARRTADGPTGVSAGRPYLRGVLVSLTNPKLLLFFLAVLPQFLGSAQNAELQLAMLGVVNVLSEVVLYGTVGVLAGVFHARFSSSRYAGAVLNYVAGAVYAGLGVFVAAEVAAGFGA
ncbi:LysE family translocator [Arthrobacter sp. ATA002]|uniref:LysE family translocator n=1 Tax=Arthrobacter sp. ATA002 TaxID=2991715 RepID=UPI0022A740F4|nr:LysE family translocator [Arthrobacter sp. ATA002]WAP51471.1 LysE family translocator [Arthrobacter sp. ATA002]